MATVVKNFRIKSGLIVEGTSATIAGNEILSQNTQAGDSYILNLVGGATLVKSVDSGVFSVDGSGNLTVNANTFDSYGSASAAQAAAEATASADATSKASAAQSAAITAAATDATTKVAAEAALRVSGDAASVSTAAADATSKADAAQAAAISAAAADATSKANAAQAGAEATAAAALSAAIATEVSDRNTAIGTAVDSLVDGAPALLNTLNELAAAINDDANYTTTLTSALATKANSADVTASLATAASNASADATSKANAAQAAAEATASADATSKANAAQAAAEATASADATSKANAAQSAAEATASADATSKANAAQAAAEATAAAANTAQQAGTTAFTALNINDEAKQIAASSTSLGSVVVTAYEWPKAAYRSGKFVVKIDNGTHNEISEILVTLDSSDNVAITEYAIVGTNGARGTITASVSGANVQLRVDPVNDSTIKVTGTLLK
jgi:hypothetical protein